MSCREDVFFQIHTAVAKGADSFRGCLQIGVLQFLRRPNQPDTTPAAPCTGFEHNGVADSFRRDSRFFHGGNRFCARNDGQSCAPYPFLQHGLVAQAFHPFRVRADEYQSILSAKPGKMCVFRKETVSGMDGLGTGQNRGADDLIFIEIALRGFRAADAIALVRKRHMQSIPICFGIYRHRRNAHFLAGPDNADGNLSTVGNQYF